nr:hypothetical protein [Cysteiniphilum sp. JM-1]
MRYATSLINVDTTLAKSDTPIVAKSKHITETNRQIRDRLGIYPTITKIIRNTTEVKTNSTKLIDTLTKGKIITFIGVFLKRDSLLTIDKVEALIELAKKVHAKNAGKNNATK